LASYSSFEWFSDFSLVFPGNGRNYADTVGPGFEKSTLGGARNNRLEYFVY